MISLCDVAHRIRERRSFFSTRLNALITTLFRCFRSLIFLRSPNSERWNLAANPNGLGTSDPLVFGAGTAATLYRRNLQVL